MSDLTGAERITAERQRQIEKEGWTPEHDDEHANGELAWAAVCYAAPPNDPVFVRRNTVFLNLEPGEVYEDPWPWDTEWDKRAARGCTRDQRIRDLVKAGALIAAEIDRLLRAYKKSQDSIDPVLERMPLCE